MTETRTIDINDPDYQLHAKVFNAITFHPDVDVLFSRRTVVADKAIAAIWRQMRRERRRRWWFQFKMVRTVRGLAFRLIAVLRGDT